MRSEYRFRSMPAVVVIALSTASGCLDGPGQDQCPESVAQNEWLTVRTDAELAELEGVTDAHSIHLLGPELSDLSALHCLRNVNFLAVTSSPFTNLEGLEGLRELGELSILDNPSLTSLHGLEGLDAVAEIAIAGNEQISDLSALSHIETTGLVNIQMNPALTSLDDLASLRRISNSRLQVAGNTSLKTISGMTNLEYVQDGIVVIGNPALEPCDDFVLAAHVESPVPHDLQSDPSVCN